MTFRYGQKHEDKKVVQKKLFSSKLPKIYCSNIQTNIQTLNFRSNKRCRCVKYLVEKNLVLTIY